ncbi:PAS domain-containing sensor histidine kinase [Ferrovibrio sp.]|uniref:sensor histidine kinase n=1 Tax=Ferrovibrio sp. TaxID=1917215 RepID=UPI003D0B287C
MNNLQDSLLAFIPEAVITIGPDQRIIDFNRMAESIFGYSRREIIGQPLELLIPLPSRATHREHVARFAQSHITAYMMHSRREVTGMRRNGSLFPAEASLLKAERDGVEVILAVLRDVTERRDDQARMLASERKHRAIMEGCPDAILMVDIDNGSILDANPTAGEMLGCMPAALIGRRERDLHPEGSRGLVERFAAAAIGDRPLVYSTSLCHAEGNLLPVEISARRMELDGHGVLAAFYRDIRHHKLREAKLQQALEEAAESAHAKSMFLANMSHELRTPLNGIIGFAEMIAMEINGPLGNPKYSEYGRLIVTSAEHLLSLVNDILDLSALEAGKLRLQREELRLKPLIEECLTLLQPLIDDGRILVTVCVPPEQLLSADRRALRQMLLNLIANAVKYTPEGGSIAIEAVRAEDGLRIDVCDSGPGIAADMLQQVLEPFGIINNAYTRRHGGAGLGLSITKRLAELHGGSLVLARIDPARGGTRASLWFPLSPA